MGPDPQQHHFVRPGIEIVTVDAAQVREAEDKIEGLEHCHPDDAELPFDWLGHGTPWQGGLETARWPSCRTEINERTLVEPK